MQESTHMHSVDRDSHPMTQRLGWSLQGCYGLGDMSWIMNTIPACTQGRNAVEERHDDCAANLKTENQLEDLKLL